MLYSQFWCRWFYLLRTVIRGHLSTNWELARQLFICSEMGREKEPPWSSHRNSSVNNEWMGNVCVTFWSCYLSFLTIVIRCNLFILSNDWRNTRRRTLPVQAIFLWIVPLELPCGLYIVQLHCTCPSTVLYVKYCSKVSFVCALWTCVHVVVEQPC